MNSKLIWQFASLAVSIGIAVHAPLANATSQKAARPHKRLAPLPPEKEWWITADNNGHLLPILTDPWLDPISAKVVRDRATDLWWKGPAGLPVSIPLSLQGAQKVCAANNLMRLPTRHEVESIIDRYRSGPVINAAILPGLASDFYWTLTPSSPGSNWVFHTDDGRFAQRSNSESAEARFFCVADMRASAPPSHYDVSPQIIRDNATGLFWHIALTSADDFQRLADACDASTISNIQWRVPTIKELLSIMSPQRPAPYIDPVFLNNSEITSSTSADGYGGIQFQGVSYQTGKRISMEGTRTRCVSNGKLRSANPGRIFKGNVEILSGYENGNLALQTVEASQLRSIEGNVLLQGIDSSALVLPYLETIKGDLTIVDTKLEEIHLPNLTAVEGSITINGNRVLRKISMRSLTSIGKDFILSRNTKLGIEQATGDSGTIGGPVRMESLRNIDGAMNIEYNDQLKTLYLPALQTVGRQLFITQNASIWWLQARRLVSIGSNCKSSSDSCGSLDVGSNSKLEALSLDSLDKIEGDLTFQSNSVLNDFANKLNLIGLGLYVRNNKSLCARDRIDPFLYRMWSKHHFPGKIQIIDNNPEEKCRTACPNREGTNCSIER